MRFKFTFESPEVQSLLVGVYRSSPQTYYRVDETGKHIYPIRRHLMELGMCSKTASLYLKRANLEITPFTRAESEPTTTEQAPTRRGPPPISEEAREAKRLKAEAAENSKRYQLIESSSRKNGTTTHGIWDEVAGRVIEIFPSRDLALDALIQLKTGNSYAIN